MTAVIAQIDVEAAQRRAERIRFHATNANDAMVALRKLVNTARELDDHITLGYASWTAYIRDLFGDEPLRLARDVRQELVAELSAQGMSTRAIEGVVSASRPTIIKDIREARASEVVNSLPPAPVVIEGVAADPATGEVIEPSVTEHTVTEKVRTVTGLDGKEYKTAPKPQKEPAPVLVGDAANQQNAKQAAREIGRSLETLLGFTFNGYRARIITEWWPIGKDEVPPSQSDLFTPSQLRHIAQGLIQTATEMEAHRV